ncbi:hypothetical protein GUJ93_ZPchr0006g46189 [Zizania palustris]|uniref:Uncharacterized protein n=1 Tax=Zizania palustris TaxID=103762 RepID=A0A8J5TAJ5_ZIZPA|nr:hypothetical protein GUJ93_ZPchr0006g46189 [Zizania palustris]
MVEAWGPLEKYLNTQELLTKIERQLSGQAALDQDPLQVQAMYNEQNAFAFSAIMGAHLLLRLAFTSPLSGMIALIRMRWLKAADGQMAVASTTARSCGKSVAGHATCGAKSQGWCVLPLQGDGSWIQLPTRDFSTADRMNWRETERFPPSTNLTTGGDIDNASP